MNPTVSFSSLLYRTCSILLLQIFFGYDSVSPSEHNAALNRTTFQSSDFDDSSSSSLAVDGDVTTCSRTEKLRGTTWTVDLGEIVTISKFRITVGDKFYLGAGIDFLISSSGNGSDPFSCYFPFGSENPGYTFSCFHGVTQGRSLVITNKYTYGLHLCEVQVIVCDDGFFGINCTNVCRCDEGNLCNKSTGECPERRCAAGWNGSDCQTECMNGTFGKSCRGTCHCDSESSCDKYTGSCSKGCATSWIGPSCQTAIPEITKPPTLYSATPTEITIIFDSWSQYIDPKCRIYYLIDYKRFAHQGNVSWIRGVQINDSITSNEKATITGLKINSFYEVRVTPILEIGNEEIRGQSHQEIPLFKTLCSIPQAPDVVSIESYCDTQRQNHQAGISVRWKVLTKEHSNCDNIARYLVYYKKHGDPVWKSVGAPNSASSKQISSSDLEFGVKYSVRVASQNNAQKENTSDPWIIQILPKPPSSHVDPGPLLIDGTTDFFKILSIILGIVVALTLGIIAIQCMYTTRIAKRIPHQYELTHRVANATISNPDYEEIKEARPTTSDVYQNI